MKTYSGRDSGLQRKGDPNDPAPPVPHTPPSFHPADGSTRRSNGCAAGRIKMRTIDPRCPRHTSWRIDYSWIKRAHRTQANV